MKVLLYHLLLKKLTNMLNVQRQLCRQQLEVWLFCSRLFAVAVYVSVITGIVIPCCLVSQAMQVKDPVVGMFFRHVQNLSTTLSLSIGRLVLLMSFVTYVTTMTIISATTAAEVLITVTTINNNNSTVTTTTIITAISY